MKKRTVILSALLVTIGLPMPAYSFTLEGTLFEKAAKTHNVDPLLLYSVALGESARLSKDKKNHVEPSPWAFHAGGKAFYAETKDEAKTMLDKLTSIYGQHIDVGVMQISIRWNGHRVSTPYDLLDPETNIMVGAEIISENLKSSPNDKIQAVGRYNSWDKAKAESYGSYVVSIFNNLKKLQNSTNRVASIQHHKQEASQ